MADCLVQLHMADHLVQLHMADHLVQLHMADCLVQLHMADHLVQLHMADHLVQLHMADHLVQLHMADCLVLHRAAEGFLSVFSRSVQYTHTHTHTQKSTIWDFEGSIRKADDAGNPILPSHHSAMGDEATDLCDKASNERKIRRPAHTSIVHHQHIASLKQKDNQQVSMLSVPVSYTHLTLPTSCCV